MESLFQFILELLLQLLFEGGFDALLRRKGPGSPLAGLLLFIVLGGLAGAISLWVVPTHLIDDRSLRYLSGLVTPLLIAWLMTAIGKRRVQRGAEPFSLERFAFSWAFAFSFGAVRILFATQA